MAYGVKLHCWGEWGCFTRPEMKVERLSYEVITPSAARGILEAIYWKPEIRWVIDKLTVLNPIRFTNIRRNEIGSKIPARSAQEAMSSGAGDLGVWIEEVRQQRASMVLCDVAYIIAAHFEILTGPNNPAKHLDQFCRRARSGQCHTRPYFGCREFAAHFALVEENATEPVPHASLTGERDLGWLLHYVDFNNANEPTFFRAVMRDGIITVSHLQGATA